MEKWADYLVSKEKWVENTNTIDCFIIHVDNGNSVGKGIERDRNWVVQKLKSGKTFYCITLNEEGLWNRLCSLSLNKSNGLNGVNKLPLILTKRKSFISYYHKDDFNYKKKFENLTSDLIINKSVEDGDIDSDVSDEYAKQLIQKGYLNDTTVLIVLLGEKTKCRKHVDWEISGALNYKVGNNYTGILGLKLPSHSDFGTGKYTFSKHPQRLVDNLKSGYALIRDYTTDRKKLQEYIELASKMRKSKSQERINSRIQMKKNTCK